MATAVGISQGGGGNSHTLVKLDAAFYKLLPIIEQLIVKGHRPDSDWMQSNLEKKQKKQC